MDSTPLTADEIRAQMRGIRRDLRANVKGMVKNASEMFDWRSYVRSFPWTSLAVAGVLGYFLVPRRMKVIAYDKQTLENFLREKNLIAAPPPPEKRQSSLLGTVLPIVGGVALRLAVSYGTKFASEMLASATQGSPQSQETSPRQSRPPVVPGASRLP